MRQERKEASFTRQFVMKDRRPHLYIAAPGEVDRRPEKPVPPRERPRTVKKEHDSDEILEEMRHKFTGRIQEIRGQGEAASEIPEVLSVSREGQRISREQSPRRFEGSCLQN